MPAAAQASKDIILSLPAVLKQHICSFLPPKDALSLASTCHSLAKETVAFLKPPLELVYSDVYLPTSAPTYDQSRYCYAPQLAFSIPVYFPRKSHSIWLKGSWNGHGLTFSCSQLILTEQFHPDLQSSSPTKSIISTAPAETPISPAKKHSNVRVLWTSPPAPRTLGELQFFFSPKPHCTYHVWYQCHAEASGGSPYLMVENLYMYSVVYDPSVHLGVFRRLVDLNWIPELLEEDENDSGDEQANDNGLKDSFFPLHVWNHFSDESTIKDDATMTALSTVLSSPHDQPDEHDFCDLKERQLLGLMALTCRWLQTIPSDDRFSVSSSLSVWWKSKGLPVENDGLSAMAELLTCLVVNTVEWNNGATDINMSNPGPRNHVAM